MERKYLFIHSFPSIDYKYSIPDIGIHVESLSFVVLNSFSADFEKCSLPKENQAKTYA